MAKTTKMEMLITGDATEFLRAMNQAEAAGKAAGLQIKTSVKTGATEAGTALQQFAGASATAAQSYMKDQRMQGRQATFLARELLDLGIAGRESGESLRAGFGLALEGLGALRGGFNAVAVGLIAFEGVKLAVSLFNQFGESAKKAAEEAEKVRTKSLDLAKTLSGEVVKSLDQVRDRLEKAFGVDPTQAGNRRKVIQLQNEIAALRAEEDAKAKAGEYEGQGVRLAHLARLEVELAKATTAERNYLTIRKAAEGQEEKTKSADEARKSREEEELRRKKLLADAEKTLADARAEAYQRGEFPDLSYSQSTWDEMQVAKDKKAGDAAQQKLNEKYMEGWQGGEFPDLENKLQKHQEKVKSLGEVWQGVGGSVASAFSSIGTAIGGTAGQFISAMGQMIAQTLALIVALATSDALATGPIGLFAAIPAAAGILAAVIGMMGGISGRAIGGSVNTGMPVIVGEAGTELFVPSVSGSIVSNGQLGGRGSTVNLVVNSVDAASFEKMLRRNDNALVRVLRDATRAGRA